MNTLSFNTSFGWITIKENNKKLVSVKFCKTSNRGSNKYLISIRNQIMNFFLGKLKKFETNIFLSGTPIQKKIWKTLLKIPYGKTISYGEIAKRLNTSPRYVGKVCGQNNHLLIIPCHRVICVNGSLGGFSGLGGTNLKKRIITLEQND